MIYIGIDPGIFGSVAVINEHCTVTLIDTPTIEIKKGKSKKNVYSEAEMAAVLRTYCNLDVHVFMEKVNAMPGQGVTSMFNFGMSFGIWKGILAALSLPYTLITPQSWKKELMQGIKDKDASRIRAQQLFPQCIDKLNRKKDIGRSDALLIAEFGRRSMKG